MKKIKPSELGELKVSELIKSIPEDLKDPKKFEPIERKINLIMKSDHQHRTIGAFAKCKRCKAKREKRTAYIKELGFSNYEQYIKWKKIMVIINNKKDFEI